MKEIAAMYLYLIRHAEAVPQGHDNLPDEARPLTEVGRVQCRAVAMALRCLGVQIDRILTSPLMRARQTAEELIRAWGEPSTKMDETRLLAPGTKKRKLARLLRDYEGESVALVGHNPDISELCGWFLGERHLGLDMDKGGVACVQFEDRAGKGVGVLSWLVTPAWCEMVR